MLGFSVTSPSPNCYSKTSSFSIEEKGKIVFDRYNQVLNQLKMEFGSISVDKSVQSGENPSVGSDVVIDHDIDFGTIWFDSTNSSLSLFRLD